MIKNLLFFIVSLLFFQQPAVAESYQIRGLIASFYYATTAGCITRTQFVFVAQEAMNSRGGNGQSTLFVLNDVYDTCNKVTILNERGVKTTLESSEYTLRKSYARVTSSVNVIDSVAGTERWVVADLTWIGTGQPATNRSRYSYNDDGVKIIGNSFATNETAIVIGSISGEEINVLGNIETTRSGEIIISR